MCVLGKMAREVARDSLLCNKGDGKTLNNLHSATQVKDGREGKLYAICEIPIKQEEGGTTQQPQETTTIEVSTATPGKNETSEISEEDEGFILTDEVLIILFLYQLPALILSLLRIIEAFHKYGCTCQGLRFVMKAFLLLFLPFFAIEYIGYCLHWLGIHKIHEVC